MSRWASELAWASLVFSPQPFAPKTAASTLAKTNTNSATTAARIVASVRALDPPPIAVATSR
jgi:hypothetical protein